MKPSYFRRLAVFVSLTTTWGLFLFTLGCTKAPEAVQVNHPDTKSFMVTHNLQLSNRESERQIASTKDEKALKGLFAKKFSYDFDYVSRGQTSRMVEFYVYELNPKDDVTITSVSVTGTNAQEFIIVDKPEMPLPLKQTSFYIKMMFTPRTGGDKKAVLTVVSKDHGAYRFDISGNSGNGPELAFSFLNKDEVVPLPTGFKMRSLASTAPLAPGQCEETPQKFNYRVQNQGRTPLTLTGGRIEGGQPENFRVASEFPVTLAANEQRNLTVEFTGGQPTGHYSSELVIDSNDANEAIYRVPVSTFTHGPLPCLQLAITGRPNETPTFKPVASRPNHALGMVPVGSIVNLTLHLKNTGFQPLHFTTDKLAFLLQPNPAPVAMSLTFPPTGVHLEPGQAMALPIGVAASDTRIPFTAEIRFTLAEPVESPATLTASINGVVGNPQPKQTLDLSVTDPTARD